jgi:hypothetical protein
MEKGRSAVNSHLLLDGVTVPVKDSIEATREFT